ncbi:MAG: hypothetical protein ACXVLQ_10420 [Bacteriovorax sp.]
MAHLDNRFKKFQPAVIAVFKNHDLLEKTLEDLKKANFKNEDISLLTAKRSDLKKISYHENILEGVAAGTITGMAEGGILCWLASLSMVAIPGAGTFIAAGPFISAIAGAALGANVGSIAGALIGFGATEMEAKKLEKYVKDKGVIVAVHVNDPKEQLMAKKILVTNGAVEIFNPSEKESAKQKFFDQTF